MLPQLSWQAGSLELLTSTSSDNSSQAILYLSPAAGDKNEQTMPDKTIQKEKRTRLTLGQQAEVVRKLRTGHSTAEIMRIYNVSSRTVSKMRASGDIILNRARESSSLNTKSTRAPHFPLLEEKLYTFVTIARNNKLPITCSDLQERAMVIRDEELQKPICEKLRSSLQSFTASKGWLVNFFKRHAIRSGSLSGEAGRAHSANVIAGIDQLRSKLTSYDVDCIFNVDATGLFFKLFPRRTYICELENRKSVCGTQAMRSKDRITAYVCTSASGVRVPLCVIGTAKNPQCFRIDTPPVHYLHQKNAWSDSQTFKQWFCDLFLPFIRRFTSRPVALLMDNNGPHGVDVTDHSGQVTIFTLPPNCSAIHLPMGLGITESWKLLYRRLLLEEISKDLETRQQRRDESVGLRQGMRGISEGYDPHLLDVTRMVEASWNKVTEMTICRCWVMSEVLPTALSTELNATYGRMQNTSKEGKVREMTKMLARMALNLDSRDPLFEQLQEKLTGSMVEHWVNIEDDDDVKEALVDDEMRDSVEDGEEDVVSIREPLPPQQNILHMLNELEDIAYKSVVKDAISLLRQARRAFTAAKRVEMKGEENTAVENRSAKKIK